MERNDVVALVREARINCARHVKREEPLPNGALMCLVRWCAGATMENFNLGMTRGWLQGEVLCDATNGKGLGVNRTAPHRTAPRAGLARFYDSIKEPCKLQPVVFPS